MPLPPRRETGRSVAVVGAGPAGMAAAQQLRRAGHRVVALRARRGGRRPRALRRARLQDREDRRRAPRAAARRRGRRAALGVDVGVDVSAEELREQFDAVVLAIGSRVPRDLPVPGRELDGVHFAMDYLYVRNRWVARLRRRLRARSRAKDKNVIVIGGGDTGADCVGNSIREGAASVVAARAAARAAGLAPRRAHAVAAVAAEVPPQLRDGGGQGGGRGEQDFSVVTTELTGNGRVQKLHYAQAQPAPPFGAGRGHRAACSTPTSCCWRWASCTPSTRAPSTSCRSRRTRAATSGPRPTPRASRASSPPATRAAASRSSCGRSTRAASARAWSTATSKGSTASPSSSAAATPTRAPRARRRSQRPGL